MVSWYYLVSWYFSWYSIVRHFYGIVTTLLCALSYKRVGKHCNTGSCARVEAGPDLIPSRSGVWTLRSAGLYRYQHVEVDLSLFVSERICGIRCRKFRHYSIIPFLLSLSVYSELTAIKTFTGINLAQSLHVCKPWCKRALVWYPLARLHGLKQKYFQHCDVTNCPAPRIENIPNRATTVSYRTKPWILWTHEILCHGSVRTSVRYDTVVSRFDTISVQQGKKKKSTMLGFFSLILNRQ